MSNIIARGHVHSASGSSEHGVGRQQGRHHLRLDNPLDWAIQPGRNRPNSLRNGMFHTKKRPKNRKRRAPQHLNAHIKHISIVGLEGNRSKAFVKATIGSTTSRLPRAHTYGTDGKVAF